MPGCALGPPQGALQERGVSQQTAGRLCAIATLSFVAVLQAPGPFRGAMDFVNEPDSHKTWVLCLSLGYNSNESRQHMRSTFRQHLEDLSALLGESTTALM